MALMALSISAVAPAHRATAMGVYQALYSIGMLTGPLLGGLVAETVGLGAVFYMSGAIVLLAGGLLMLRREGDAGRQVDAVSVSSH